MSEVKTYQVADPLQTWVGGIRVSDDRTITLTDEQARYPLLSGEIKIPATEAQASKPSRKALEG